LLLSLLLPVHTVFHFFYCFLWYIYAVQFPSPVDSLEAVLGWGRMVFKKDFKNNNKNDADYNNNNNDNGVIIIIISLLLLSYVVLVTWYSK